MKRRGGPEQISNLFTFFKPVSSPSTSNGTPSTKTPSKARGLNKPKSDHSDTLKSQLNGKAESRDAESNAMTTETVSDATPITSGRKRPHPLDSDEDSEGEIGARRVS